VQIQVLLDLREKLGLWVIKDYEETKAHLDLREKQDQLEQLVQLEQPVQ
jgi:hypothetical protein